MKRQAHPPMAVIELGTTSIRMVVGEVSASGAVHRLDELEHSVSLGSDTLATGSIRQETTERCVVAMRSFSEVLAEYGVEERHVRVVATSAVREASNSERFRDRLLVASGVEIEILDEAEVSRLTYRAVQPKLQKQAFFRTSDVMVVEVGGGSTETLLFRKGKVHTSHLYRLGALRLRSLVQTEDTPPDQHIPLMRAEMGEILAQMSGNLGSLNSLQMVLLGSDARFARKAIEGSSDGHALCELRMTALSKLTRKIVSQTVDEVVREYRLTYTDAETLGPSLLIATTLAESLKLKHVHVADVSLRTGILIEMATGEQWTAGYRRQVINSAKTLARKHGVDMRHANNVATVGLQILECLRSRFTITAREEVIFHVAALLHEVGNAINTASHHKHSRYIILNSDIFGLGRRDIAVAALIARYHRSAQPKPSHSDYMAMDHVSRIAVTKLAAVLRLANSLDRLHTKRPLTLDMRLQKKRFVIEFGESLDLPLLWRRVRDRSGLFEDIFGKTVVLRRKGK